MPNDPYPLGASSTVPTSQVSWMEGSQRGGRSDSIQGHELPRRHKVLLTSPLRAASMTSLSSPVACSSSVGTPPKGKYVNYDVARNDQGKCTYGHLCILLVGPQAPRGYPYPLTPKDQSHDTQKWYTG